MAEQEVPKDTTSKKPRPGIRKSAFWKNLIYDNLRTTQQQHLSHGRLDLHSMLIYPDKIRHFYSDHEVHPSRLIDNQNYARWAIEEALREYQPETNFQVTGSISKGKSVTVGQRIAKAIRADAQQEIDAEDPNGVKETDYEVIQDVGAVAEAIISASPNCLGPPIEACASYLRMKKCGEYGRKKLTVWKSPLFPQLDGQDGRKGFLDNQITAIVWIMSRFLGQLPALKIKNKELWDEAQKRYVQRPETPAEIEHRKKLRGPKYHGGILADSMGLGKTLTTVACLDILASQRLNASIENGKSKYRPMLILTPNSTVAAQWVEEIEQLSSQRGIHRIIISGSGAEKKPHQTRVHCLSCDEFNFDWPSSLNYVWDEDNFEAARAVFVMSIDTWSGRTCMTTENKSGGKEWKSSFTEKGRKFSVVVVDEAYKIRHSATRNWKSVALLERQFTLLVTATPCMNVMSDLLGPARLLWQGAENYLKKTPGKWDEIARRFPTLEDLRGLEHVQPWKDLQLAAGRPAMLALLLYRHRSSASLDIRQIRDFLSHFESLAILRRAPSSHLYMDWKKTERVPLEGLLPKVDNFTVNIQSDHALEEAYQTVHIGLLIEYLRTAKNWKRKGGKSSDLTSVLTIHRQFQLASASLDVHRLDNLLERNGFGAKAEHVYTMRKANVNFTHLAPFLLEPGDPEPEVALDYIKLAVRKSPVLRYILHHVKENLLNRGTNGKIKKLLITEASPILAYYYELVLQFLLIHCRTLHAGLKNTERRELIASFNDDSDHSCQILIQMYTVGFAGSNLHKNCSQVLVASQAHSLPVQWQAVHRVIRVGQESDVQVYRLKVNNSYHSFRESRQVEKILPELATRARGPLNRVFVQLLNLFQFEVDDAWKRPEALELVESMNLLTDPVVEEEDEMPAPKRIKLEDGTTEETEAANEELIPSSEKSPTTTLGKRKREDSEPATLLSTASFFKKYPWGFLAMQRRERYYKQFMSYQGKIKSSFCHKKNNLRRLLSYGGPHNNATRRKWSVEDLDNVAVLERAMELTLRIRLGANNIEMLPLPQIDFSLVPKEKLADLAKLMRVAKTTDQDIEAAREKLGQRAQQKARSKEMERNCVREIKEEMDLDKIDEMLNKDITSGETEGTRKRRKQEEAAEAWLKTQSLDNDGGNDVDFEGEEHLDDDDGLAEVASIHGLFDYDEDPGEHFEEQDGNSDNGSNATSTRPITQSLPNATGDLSDADVLDQISVGINADPNETPPNREEMYKRRLALLNF
ncbi:SNF2 family N-terminal domain-containing protein [Hypomontagnella monticulosa]|nr:SNF2 family N-terminal domain-containing protein [Hypomontagnella monticulosa]